MIGSLVGRPFEKVWVVKWAYQLGMVDGFELVEEGQEMEY